MHININTRLVDTLIGYFNAAGLLTNLDEKEKGFGKYDYPNISFTQNRENGICNMNFLNQRCLIESFGAYFNYNAIYGIILFYDPIWDATIEYTETNTTTHSNSEIFEALTEIVFIHESVHWLVDLIWFNLINYQSKEDIEFHECLAQYFTKKLIRENPLYIQLFDWLEKKEGPLYSLYHELDNFFSNADNLHKAVEHLKLFNPDKISLPHFLAIANLYKNSQDEIASSHQDFCNSLTQLRCSFFEGFIHYSLIQNWISKVLEAELLSDADKLRLKRYSMKLKVYNMKY